MKKIAIITLHHVRNIGSMLQTYATQTIFEKKGFETEVINYIPKGLRFITGVNTIKNSGKWYVDLLRKMFAFFWFGISQIRMMKFNHQYLKLSSKIYHTFPELNANPPKADIYVVGSDQVWNTQNRNEPDDIRSYYLDFVPEESKKIAFSSSIGKDRFTNEETKEVCHYLSSFSAVSVRESFAKELLESIGIRNVEHVLDPTLLLTAEEWLNFASNGVKLNAPYVFVYNLNRNADLVRFALQLAQKENIRIVNFTGLYGYIKDAYNFTPHTPNNFIRLIAGAQYVVTDSFHGTAFSINFNKQFITFHAPKFNSRIDSILKVFNLENRLWNENFKINDIYNKINYTEVNQILATQRNITMQFLNLALTK